MMNCNKQYTIKVTEGNAFGLLLQLKSRTFQSSVPIDEDIDATHLEYIVIKVNNEAFTDFTADESGVLMNIPADMAVGTYNVELTGSYYDVEIRAGYFQCFSIVPWSYQSDAVNYIPGSPIATEAAYVVVGIIDDQELEDLKAELRLKIAAAEAAKEAADQAKEDFDEKAEALDNLDNVAQQGTNPDATLTSTQTAAQGAALNSQIARGYIGTPQSGQADTLFGAIANINIDTSTIAKQGSDPSVNITGMDAKLGDVEDALEYIEGGGLPTITAIAKQGTNASATLTATQAAVVDGNDTAITAIKDVRSEVGTSSDTASESGTTLFAVLKWVKDKVKDVYNALTDNTSGLAAIKQAILDNAGIPTMTIPNTTASQELAPNTLYIFASRSAALTLTLGTPIVGVANEYHLFLVTDSATAPTITWPTGISWNGGSAPTIASDKTYEISILNNVAAYFEV